MQHNSDLSAETVSSFNNSAVSFSLSPNDYLVWHALVVTCSTIDEDADYYYAASIADVARVIRINRETVKRSIQKLAENGLAKKVNDRWIFLAIEEK